MSKIMFGMAMALALGTSTAWAGDEKPDEKAASDAVAVQASTSLGQTEGDRTVEAGRERDAIQESKEVRASQEDERWLREREGYRDGGY